MSKVTIDDLVAELDNALQLASECEKPSAMIAATMSKAKLLGLDRADSYLDNEVQPVKIVIQTVDARKPASVN
ncbi:hypothetical protein [Psychrobacter urativorans]|uniref:hypothetical protein n=1 Tax=Psychrobacter urativorans TaxID=45610 RepID=UPI00191A17ED|nr:hypothetical protein [Psychrobacter urativorans]